MKRRELPATLIALATVLMLVVLIYVRYAVATVFATAAIIYRYALWITHPPTWRYFKAGWTPFLSWQNFRRYTLLIPRADGPISSLRSLSSNAASSVGQRICRSSGASCSRWR